MSKKKKLKMKQKKSSAPATKLVEIEAKLPLTNEEKVKRGEIACGKMVERDSLILERKSVANEYKARIDALTSEATKLLLEFREGREIRKVKAREFRNFSKSQVEYFYKGVVIHSRTMTLADRQDDLPLKDKNAPLPQVSAVADEVAAAKAGAKTAKVIRIAAAATRDTVAEAHQKDEDAKRADIAGVIADETNKKSKWSSVDGENPHA